MKRLLLSALAAASLFTATAATAATGNQTDKNNNVVMEARRSTMNFHEIDVTHAIKLIIDDRSEGNIIIRATKDIMPYVDVTVKDGKLYARLVDEFRKKRKTVVVNNNTRYSAEVHIPNNGRISEISATGAACVIAKPTLVATNLELEATGAAQILLAADVNGKADIDCAGASSIKATLNAAECELEIAGASSATLSGSTQKCDIKVAGASKMNAGDFKCHTLEASVVGASLIVATGTTCNLQAAGASKATIHCDGTLSAEAIGASKIIYSGNCTIIKASNSGASKIQKQIL
ncbi:MAG: GIN domain-containing protein [Alistipes sp.]